MINLHKARMELISKTLKQIQTETAFTWASRAIVAFENSAKVKNPDVAMKWLLEAEEYKHEALEHAALLEDGGKLLKKLCLEFKHNYEQLKASAPLSEKIEE